MEPPDCHVAALFRGNGDGFEEKPFIQIREVQSVICQIGLPFRLILDDKNHRFRIYRND